MNSIDVKYVIITLLILLLESTILFADHGKDFTVTETIDLPEPKSFWLLLSVDFGSEEQLNSEPECSNLRLEYCMVFQTHSPLKHTLTLPKKRMRISLMKQ